MNSLYKLCFISLGCDKNLADSEKMLGILEKTGCTVTDLPEDADIAVINTCCFILDAKKQSLDTILEIADIKKNKRPGLKIVVAGCMAERYRNEIFDALPEVDAVVGTNSWQDIAEAVDAVLNEKKHYSCLTPLSENRSRDDYPTYRALTGTGSYAYLKIAEGCNKRCTYCAIPYFRGPYRSVPLELLVKEAGELAAAGVRELILVAQETTVYGVDLYGRKMLPELLRRLHDIDGIIWIRILYCYPEEITDELIKTVSGLPKVCNYLDIPVQHSSDHVLRLMGRATTGAEIRERLYALRNAIPDIRIRTTVMTGFPGETERDHKELCAFIREMRFDRLGCFRYSREEGTRASSFSHQVSARIKDSRYSEIMEIQQEIAFSKASGLKGQIMDAVIDEELNDSSGYIYLARSYMDLPEVDSQIAVKSRKRFNTGEIKKVRIIRSAGYDLIGEFVC